MIRNTEKVAGEEDSGTISAYSDNAAVFEGSRAPRMGVRECVYGAEERCESVITVRLLYHMSLYIIPKYPAGRDALPPYGRIAQRGRCHRFWRRNPRRKRRRTRLKAQGWSY